MIVLISAILLVGCSISGDDKQKVKDIEFTVVPNEGIPDELKKLINEKKKETMKLTYNDKESLYIVVGYGEQPTGGYSIKVTDLYESKNGIYIKTDFVGPSKTENISQKQSYPFVVVKIEYSDKPVIFE